MKVLCLALLLLGGLLFPNSLDGSRACAASIAIDETNFPDANFRSFVSSKYDKDEDNVLSNEEAGIISMLCRNQSIASLKGIEYFTALTTLNCQSSQLTTLDGRKLNSRPHKKGLYIHNGRRIVVK